MKKWLKRFLVLFVILASIIIYRLVTFDEEDAKIAKEYLSVPGNFVQGCYIKFLWLKTNFYHIIGNQEQEVIAYGNLINYYEYCRYIYQRYGADENEISQWFTDKAPDYKNAALLNLESENSNTAFYYSELCRSRTLTDHYADVLVSQSDALEVEEKEKLKNYSRETDNLLKKIQAGADRSSAETEYRQLKKEEKAYKHLLRQKYSNLMITKDRAKQEEYNYVLDDEKYGEDISKSFWERFESNFNLQKMINGIPKTACLIEFMKISDDSIIAFVIRGGMNVERVNISAVNIPTDKKFYENLQLYHDLNAYTDIDALHRDGKYFWNLFDGNYKITTGRNAPDSSAKAINDNSKWIELRQKLSNEIGQKIIAPVAKFVGGSMYWIISPDAELNTIPFETLDYNGTMLVESVNVSYVPSLAVLNMMQHRERKNFYLGIEKDLLAMGDAVYGDNTEETSRGSQAEFFKNLRGRNADDFVDMKSLRWSNLPGTEREIDKVGALFESKDIFKRNDASEKNLKDMNEKGQLAQYKYLLFATHGLFVPEMPEWSSIVLSQDASDEDNDGYVTITEWMGYDLRSSLIYLSACETGLGDYQVGEGIMGIPYALTVAGNKDTVMSLWKVDDEATAEFTSSFFEKLIKGQPEVKALNDTKREFLKKDSAKYRSPSVWSAFVLYGI